jgi:hypothetical protein
MSCPTRLSQWQQEVSTAFAHLSKAQALGLALWSAGIALTGSSGITHISALLAFVLQQKEGTIFQRLREWYLDSAHKRGDHRRELEVTTCFAPLLRWIVRLMAGRERRLALALDASTLADRWTVLAISVVVGGCAIPVAWKVIGCHAKGSWRPYWEHLLEHLQGCVPQDWLVLMLADRGLYASWLFEAIQRNGWHPFLRINMTVKARPVEEETFDWLSRWVPQPGTYWQGEVDCFIQKKSRLRCTLLLHWEVGHEHPWAIITDLAAKQAHIAWYGMRAWIEAGFKDVKRGGIGWHHSKMQDAGRVERLWLAYAVALVWTVSLGSQAEQQMPAADLDHLPPLHIARQRVQRAAGHLTARRLSAPLRGRLVLLASLLRTETLLLGQIMAGPWPLTVMAPKRALHPSKQRQREKRREHKRRHKAAKRRAAAS